VTKISDSAIAGLAQGAGLSGDAVAIAVAIALAESGGDPAQVTNTPATGDLSYGLWQINMIGSMGPDRRRAFGLTDNNQLLDPATNAKVMSTLSSGGTYWNPWTTYTRGTYKLFLARGQAAASAPGSNGHQQILFTALDRAVLDKLRDADLDQLKPLEALNLLAELKKQIS